MMVGVVDKVRTRASLLDLPVDLINAGDAVTWISAYVEKHRADAGNPAALVVTLNPEMVVLARHDRGFAAIVQNAALVLADGVGLVRALRRRGYAGLQRAAGADVLEMYLLQAANQGHKVAFVGAGRGVAEAAADRVRARFPRLAMVADGGDPDESTAARIAEARPDVVFAAYGAGRQERFLSAYLSQIGAAVGMGVGGSLDYLAGRVPRAPQIVQRAQLEWFWRLLLQPWRWRRQTALPRFWWLERKERKKHA